MLAMEISVEFNLVIRSLVAVWKSMTEQIQALERQLRHQANVDPTEATYRSAPAVGPMSARVLANELGDMSQFKNERQLFSYTGLTPRERSSGDTIRKGRITKQGNTHLRGILIEIAWRARGKDPDLARHYDPLATRMGQGGFLFSENNL